MASVFSLDKQVASLPKHGFPLSHTFDFTSSCGHIIPVFFDQLNPGEKIRFSCDLFTRTQPLSSPAMVDIDEFVDLFFIPLRKISAVADNVLFQISDLPSSNFVDQTGTLIPSTQYPLPLLDLSALYCPSDGTANQYLGVWNDASPYGYGFESFYSGSVRLFDALGVDPSVLLLPNSSVYTPKISPAAFACYQAIYFDYFRLSNWENNDILAYNLDAGYKTMDLLTTNSPWTLSNKLRSLLQLRYRAKQKDYFTNVYPSPLISNSGMLSSGIQNLSSVNQWLVDSGYVPINEFGSNFYNGTGTTLSPLPTATPISNIDFKKLSSAASLRTMFAVDKLMKVTARAGKHYDDQVLSHFGFKVPEGFSNEVVHIGQHHSQIHIGEVISTASTSDGNLGELAGKGYGKGNSSLGDFTAPCHGYVMAVYSSAPRVCYIGGLQRIHTNVSRYDWFIPELDNLGMQPMFNYERFVVNGTPTGRRAWQLRYSQMKLKYNRATYAFLSSLSLPNVLLDQKGPFADWVINDLGLLTFSFSDLLVNPCLINQVMLSSYIPTDDRAIIDVNPERIYASDPLIHHLSMTVSKISGMSVYGLDDKAI